MLRQLARVTVLAACVMAAATPVEAQDWGHIVTMGGITSSTVGRLCSGNPNGFGRYFEIQCASFAPSITTAGDVLVTGNLSAAQFIGDGSLLTGLSGGDRIVSGTSNHTNVITTSATSSISLTTAGTERMSILSNGNVGLGTSTPNGKMQIAYDSADLPNTGLYTHLELTGATYPSARLALGTTTTGGLSTTKGFVQSLFSAGGWAQLLLNPNGGNVGIGTTAPRAALQVCGSFVFSTSAQVTTPSLYVGTNGNVGVGTASPGYPFHFVGSGYAASTFGINQLAVGQASGQSGYRALINQSSSGIGLGVRNFAGNTNSIFQVEDSGGSATPIDSHGRTEACQARSPHTRG